MLDGAFWKGLLRLSTADFIALKNCYKIFHLTLTVQKLTVLLTVAHFLSRVANKNICPMKELDISDASMID